LNEVIPILTQQLKQQREGNENDHWELTYYNLISFEKFLMQLSPTIVFGKQLHVRNKNKHKQK